MGKNWRCQNCGGLVPDKREECPGCGTHRFRPEATRAVCAACQRTIPELANHCPLCGRHVRPSRLSVRSSYPTLDQFPSVLCFEAKGKTAILAEPDLAAERLYVIGPTDVLGILKEVGDFYCLTLPGGEEGYVAQAAGRILEVGQAEVSEPLGYVRCLTGASKAAVTAP